MGYRFRHATRAFTCGNVLGQCWHTGIGPAIAFICIALLVLTGTWFSQIGLWCAMSVPIVALIVWKINVRIQSSEMDLMEQLDVSNQPERLQTYSKVFLAVYFSLGIAFFVYLFFAIFFRVHQSASVLVFVFAVISIRFELWLQTIRYAIRESATQHRQSQT